jgi:ketosteroid isomerase-like protein
MIKVLVLGLTLANPIQSESTALTEVTRELTRLEHQLAAAWKGGDCEAWAAVLAPDWSVVHITGTRITKGEALQMCKAPPVPIELMEIDDISVRPFGDAAVVTGRTRVVTGGVAPMEITVRFTDVFIRQGGRWRVVASHATRIDP